MTATDVPSPTGVVMSDSYAECVYFVRCEELMRVKIGHTTNDPTHRMSQLQTGCPAKLDLFAVVDGWGREDERKIHELLRGYHVRGEWFRLDGLAGAVAAFASECYTESCPHREPICPHCLVGKAFERCDRDRERLLDGAASAYADLSKLMRGAAPA